MNRLRGGDVQGRRGGLVSRLSGGNLIWSVTRSEVGAWEGEGDRERHRIRSDRTSVTDKIRLVNRLARFGVNSRVTRYGL